MADWQELTIEVRRECAEVISSFLFDHDSTGLQEEDLGERVRLIAYFAGPPPLDALRRYAEEIDALDTPEPAAVSLRSIDEEDWAESWRFHFVPLTIGTRLFVCPPWVDERPPDRIAIVINPGMAFGTGQHATTRMCLELAEGIALARPLSSAVDLGCGSGILAIALAMLGVPRVLAVDNDPLALEATSFNAGQNGVGTAVSTASELSQLSGSTDLMVANLFTNLLAELAPAIAARLNPGGALVCSGFVDSDAVRVEQVCGDAGLRLRERRDEKPWVALTFDRP